MGETYIFHDERFLSLVIGHAKLERLWTGGRWVEGPVYVPAAKSVLWSDIPNDCVLRYDECDGSVSVFERSCGYHNGHALDREGRIVACEHGGRRVSRLDHDGVWRNLVSHVGGKQLNSPNDVVVKGDGTIWFSDPTYGIDSHYEGHRAVSEIGSSEVYRFDPCTGATRAVVTDMLRSNGLCFSPDESLLYVSGTGRTHDPECEPAIRVYPVTPEGSLGEGRLFVRSPNGFFDGFRADTGGHIWASNADAVCIFDPDGTHIGSIPVSEMVSNLCFGGPRRNRLFITAQTSLYAIYVNAHAAGWED